MRILVTGAAGFLGSHLVDRLLVEGHNIIAVDNFSTGSRSNLNHLAGNENLEMLNHDITFPLDIEVDRIFNLASPASPRKYQQDPVQTLKTNVLGALHMLDLAKRLGVRIFQASTSEVYGDPEETPQNEDYWGHVNPVGVRACYDEGKRAAETLFMDFRRQHGVDVRVARIFNTYGPRMSIDDGRVVSNFIVQALRGEDLTIYGDGNQTRSFCYQSDLIDAILRLMETETDVSPVNLGNPNEVTILDLARSVIGATNSKSDVIRLPLPHDDPKQRCPDITKARASLSWEPEVALDEGLERTIDYFSKII